MKELTDLGSFSLQCVFRLYSRYPLGKNGKSNKLLKVEFLSGF